MRINTQQIKTTMPARDIPAHSIVQNEDGTIGRISQATNGSYWIVYLTSIKKVEPNAPLTLLHSPESIVDYYLAREYFTESTLPQVEPSAWRGVNDTIANHMEKNVYPANKEG
jgi:hypothetical protein